MEEKNSRVRITVLLDDKTLKYLRDYCYETNGTTNVSKAVMLMVKEHEQINNRDDSETVKPQ